MKLLRTLLRRFGYALIPINAVDYVDIRIAVWAAQYSYAADRMGLKNPEAIANEAAIRALDPVQAESDKRAFAALLAAVEEHL
ncbi:MAG: hypothetical protein INF97_03530 [Roseomonas sp.]|nr:hypothetical protein [Roseomonas sp.]